MSPITDDEQVDELKERRRARESRPGSKRETAVRIPSAEPARDLLGGLITIGAPENGEESSASAQHAAPGPAPEALSESSARKEQARSTGPVGGEKIDELIRRVKEGTPADADVATTIQQRRPKGTADLPPSSAARRAHRRPRPSPRSRRHAARPRNSPPRDRRHGCRRRDRRPRSRPQRRLEPAEPGSLEQCGDVDGGIRWTVRRRAKQHHRRPGAGTAAIPPASGQHGAHVSLTTDHGSPAAYPIAHDDQAPR
jgi:hypothetical protein